MKLIAKCGFTSECPRILQDAIGKRFLVIGDRVPLEESIGLEMSGEERAVYIPQDVMIEAARVIMLQLAQD